MTEHPRGCSGVEVHFLANHIYMYYSRRPVIRKQYNKHMKITHTYVIYLVVDEC